MRAWRVHRHARPTEALVLDQVDAPAPGPGQVRVAVTHSVLNLNDVDGCYGRYRTVDPPLPYVAGMEVTGVVDAAGAGAEAWLGRRVLACPDGAQGGFADQALASTDLVFDAPERLTGPAAAAFFFPFHLAWLGLHERGRLESGETVLVHAAAGGIGSAAVQVAKAAGATVFATAGRPEKVEFCRKLGADHAIDYATDDFAEVVLDATGGRGVDVVFDTVGGDVAERSFRCIARNGRHLMIGFSSGIEAEDQSVTPRPVLFGNFALLGVLLAYSSQAPAIKRATGFNLVPREVGETIHAELVQQLEAGRIRPVVGKVVSFDALPAALEALERRETMGRTVVEL